MNTALTIGTLAGPSISGTAITHLGFPTTLVLAAVVIAAALGFCPPNPHRRQVLAAHCCNAKPVRS